MLLGALNGGFVQVIGGGDKGVVSQGGKDAVMMEGDDEMGLADDCGDMELLAVDGEDAVPAETAAALLGMVDEGAHEIAQRVEVRLARKIGTGEDGALDERSGGKYAGLAGEEIYGAPGLGSGSRRRSGIG